MSWEPITFEELKAIRMCIDTEYVFANSVSGLYEKLNKDYPHDQWALLRSPDWCGDQLVALVVKPRTE